MNRRCAPGFTLIELMVVILILGLLALLIVPNVTGVSDRARATKAQADISALKQALSAFYIDNGYYPATDQGLRSLTAPPQGGRVPANYPRGGYVQNIPPDPWGSEYVYQSDGNTFVLKSYGADGQEGGEGKNADLDGSQF
ncbi:MAG: type II secretion system major pseudopilin GspG [Candidatus Binataceae bacterium]